MQTPELILRILDVAETGIWVLSVTYIVVSALQYMKSFNEK